MTLAAFNIYIMGYGERLRMEQENLITHAHTSANFIGAAMGGKLKSLDTYLPKGKTKVDKKLDVDKIKDFSKRVDKTLGR